MLSELIFGKKLYEITLQDLKVYFSEEQEETSLLEFKSGSVLVDDLYKEVCAFLNTEGGVLIIGTPREEKRNPTPKTQITFCRGELTPTNYRGKDWLMSSIVSNISPPPTDIRIQEFHSEKGSHFIIEVPQSLTPPHQNNRDGKYYIRMEREARFAPHGLVEALFNKRQKAKLKPNCYPTLGNNINHLHLNVEIENLSPYPTEKVSYSVHLEGIEKVFSEDSKGHYISNLGNGICNITHTSETVLWENLSIQARYIIKKPNFPFFFSVIAWSRDVGITMYAGVIDHTTLGYIMLQYPDDEDSDKALKFYKNLQANAR